jgi:rSAM/selenodomain-associated transferase 2/rSAM/selenodomain-associated transferase 1
MAAGAETTGSRESGMRNNTRISVIIPALNEEASIGKVLADIPGWVDEVLVVDNGSTDQTAVKAHSIGARVITESRQGYGQACLAGIAALNDCDVVVFLDADYSDYPEEMDSLVDPIISGTDLVIGSRTQAQNPADCFTLPQRFGTWLACALIRFIWGFRFADLGPFRAIRRSSLKALRMQDTSFGWTIEMQIKALLVGLDVKEVPVRYRKRIGVSKISGTLRGVIGAGTGILGTVAKFALRSPTLPAAANRLLVFSRYPEPGKTKTRLISALGENGAADLQRRMTGHALECAADLQAEALVQVWFEGSDEDRMREMFSGGYKYLPQPEGDLGQRMANACEVSLQNKNSRAVIVGTDCPTISASILRKAFFALSRSDLVLGPANDGGYYLIGLRRLVPQLFEGIAWGTSDVREQTLRVARDLGVSVELLDELADVDRPEDIAAAETALACPSPGCEAGTVSVIIPTYNEADNIKATLATLRSTERIEVIVADGGSDDGTAEIAAAHGARVLSAPRGRAHQMNAGAKAAKSDLLIFLHADTLLPPGFDDAVHRALDEPGVVAGAFEFRVDETTHGLRFIERLTNWRSRRFQMPYGDQAIFVKASTFHEAGGFKEIPLMEDFDFIRRLKRRGRIVTLPLPAVTSGRRWKKLGVIRTTMINQIVIVGYCLGIPAQRLVRLYRRSEGKS